MVRTRADEATRNARTNDTARRDKALESGAQFVSTDYPEPRKEWSDYKVRLPGNTVARPNPVSGPAGARRRRRGASGEVIGVAPVTRYAS